MGKPLSPEGSWARISSRGRLTHECFWSSVFIYREETASIFEAVLMFSGFHTGPVSLHSEGENIWTKGILLNIWEAQSITDVGCRLYSGLACFNALSHTHLISVPSIVQAIAG